MSAYVAEIPKHIELDRGNMEIYLLFFKDLISCNLSTKCMFEVIGLGTLLRTVNPFLTSGNKFLGLNNLEFMYGFQFVN